MAKTKRPLIGIPTRGRKEEPPFSVTETYLDAVSSVGGEPVLMPSVMTAPESFLEYVDGFIVPGGGDVEPELYNGPPHPTIYGVDPGRDRFEIKSIHFAINKGLPSLFICRGMQIAIAAFGGHLIPHIPDEYGTPDEYKTLVRHRLDLPSKKWHPTEHVVNITAPDSRLAKVIQKTEISAVSCHHQAVKTLPPNWRAVAKAPDGIIEAVEHLYHPWAIGVQWHPELSINDSASIRLFEAFIEATYIRRAGSLVPSQSIEASAR